MNIYTTGPVPAIAVSVGIRPAGAPIGNAHLFLDASPEHDQDIGLAWVCFFVPAFLQIRGDRGCDPFIEQWICGKGIVRRLNFFDGKGMDGGEVCLRIKVRMNINGRAAREQKNKEGQQGQNVSHHGRSPVKNSDPVL